LNRASTVDIADRAFHKWPKGEDLILKRNLFIEGVLPDSILRKSSDEEMAHDRAP